MLGCHGAASTLTTDHKAERTLRALEAQTTWPRTPCRLYVEACLEDALLASAGCLPRRAARRELRVACLNARVLDGRVAQEALLRTRTTTGAPAPWRRPWARRTKSPPQETMMAPPSSV